MSKATKKKADEPIRKVGERTETIETKLSQVEIEDQRQRFIDLCQQRDQAKEDEKARAAGHKSEAAKLSAEISSCLGVIRSGRVRKDVRVEEWVTKQNEVIRINGDTREELGRRNATARELQEDLPLEEKQDDENPEDDDGDKEADKETSDDFGAGGEVH